MSKLGKVGKIALGLITPTALVVGYYIVDRTMIKKVPLFPLSLKKAQEKKANQSLATAKKKLEGMIATGEINGFGTVYNEEQYGKKYVIEVSASALTSELRNKLPNDVNGIDIKWIQADAPQAR